MFVVGDGGSEDGGKVGRLERGGDWWSERERRDGTLFFKYGCHISRRTKRKERDERAKADMGCGKNRGSG